MPELNNLLQDFDELVKNPVTFLNCSDILPTKIKSNLKETYGFINGEKLVSSKALPKLLVNNFDTEQIWQQIELQNDGILQNLLENVSKVLTKENKLAFVVKALKENKQEEDVESSDESNLQESEQRSSNDENNIDLNDIKSDDEEQSQKLISKKKTSVVDDEFFKLDEMEKFLEREENPTKDKIDEDEGSGSESDVGVDLFKDTDDLEEEEDDETESKMAKFKDFFRPSVEQQSQHLEESESDEDELRLPQSTLELRQERVNNKIKELEKGVVSEKPWTLKGEIKANDRPQNSLLEEVVEFDLTSRPAPIITEQTTFQLEDIIKRRIKDKQFDSVERKQKPIEDLLNYKKEIVLNQEKSKMSLQQIYEKEYLDQQAAQNGDGDKDEPEPVLHKEIRSMMKELFKKLDTLSDFHFTPKPAIAELKIISNLPAIAMEEVTPIAASDAALLAPEEIRKKPKGDVTGKSERTKTDKKRERRKKKKLFKNKVNKSSGAKEKIDAKGKLLLKNIEKMEETETTKTFKSSKKFFTQLQEQTDTKNVKVKRKNNAKVTLQAKKVKL